MLLFSALCGYYVFYNPANGRELQVEGTLHKRHLFTYAYFMNYSRQRSHATEQAPRAARTGTVTDFVEILPKCLVLKRPTMYLCCLSLKNEL